MPQVASEVEIAYDWEMWIGRTTIVEDAPVVNWTQIYGFEDLPFPAQVPEDVDVTHMQSPGRTREAIPGLLPVADVSLTKQYWPNNAGDELLETLSALTASGDREDVLMEFHISGAARRTYRGYVNSFDPTGTVGDKAMAAINLKVFEPQATNERVIA